MRIIRRSRFISICFFVILISFSLSWLWLFSISGTMENKEEKERIDDIETKITEEKVEDKVLDLPLPSYKVVTFYYSWYGNPEVNKEWLHWNHQVLVENGPYYTPPENIGANFYPQLGPYSSMDPVIVHEHMRQVMDIAAKYGLKVCFHHEPYPGRKPSAVREDISYVIQQYGSHPAFFRMDGKPLFFVYDSYLTPALEWAKLLGPSGQYTIRGTPLDAVMMALLVDQKDEHLIQTGGFDGGYSYFASNGFTYGSTSMKWEAISKWSRSHGKSFAPSVGPGYGKINHFSRVR